MKIAYASRTGNVESIVGQMDMDAVMIQDGSGTVSEPYVLFTYTDGYGEVPQEVETFLMANSMNMKGVVISGDTSYGEAYCARRPHHQRLRRTLLIQSRKCRYG